MAGNVVAGLAKQSGKSEEDVEKRWKEAKKIVADKYPDVKEDDDRFFQLVTGVVKKMIGIKESFIDVVDSELVDLSLVSEGKHKKKMSDHDEDEDEDEDNKDKDKDKDEDEDVHGKDEDESSHDDDDDDDEDEDDVSSNKKKTKKS